MMPPPSCRLRLTPIAGSGALRKKTAVLLAALRRRSRRLAAAGFAPARALAPVQGAAAADSALLLLPLGGPAVPGALATLAALAILTIPPLGACPAAVLATYAVLARR